MNPILQVFYSIFSGLLLSIAIPNEFYYLGMPIYGFLAFIPYYFVISISKNYKMAFLNGFLFTITTHLFSSFWLAFFKDFAIFTLGASALYTGLLGGIFAQLTFMPFCKHRNNTLLAFQMKPAIINRPSFRILYFTSIYIFYEWAKSSGFLGYPWGTVSSAMFNFPQLRQIASITGTYGITFIVVFFNCILGELFYILDIKRKSSHSILISDYFSTLNLFVVIFLATMIFGTIEYNKERKPIKTITTIMVQQNCNPWNEKTDTNMINISQRLTKEALDELAAQNKEAELVVWSEGILLNPFETAYSYYKKNPKNAPLIPFIQDCNVPFIIGGSTYKENYYKDYTYNKYYNSALVFDKEGLYRGAYAKLHLVPFAEIIPGSDNPVIKKFLQEKIRISAGWTKGENITLFDIPCSLYDKDYLPLVQTYDLSLKAADEYKAQIKPKVKIATPICFDDAFIDTMRPLYNCGTELFINITDDSWSLTKSSEYQHFVNASYRAIEFRIPLVRSTNSGYSVVIDPAGKIIADQPLFEESYCIYDVPIYERKPTTYAILGNWIILFSFAFFVYTFVYIIKNKNSDAYIPSARKIKLKKKK